MGVKLVIGQFVTMQKKLSKKVQKSKIPDIFQKNLKNMLQWRLFISLRQKSSPPEALVTIAALSSFKGQLAKGETEENGVNAELKQLLMLLTSYI